MSNSTAPISNPSSIISSSSSLLPHTTSTPPVSTTPTFTPTTSTLPDTSSVVIVSSVVTESAANGNTAPTTIFITSTAPVTSQSFLPTTASKSSTSSSSSSSTAAIASNTASASKKGSSGLSSGGKVAIAVVVPVVAVAILIVLGIWFWRRRKARKNSEELRKNEIEEYGFNPNNDPTLPPVGSGDGTSPGMTEDNSGYRGWGATSSTQRQPSTNLSSGRGGIGVAVSDEGSNGHQPGSPGHPSEAYSNEPLVAGPYGDRPTSGDSETIGALPPVAAGGKQHENIHRGPSNASSAYSTANRSDGSGDAPIPVENRSGPQDYEDGQNYYNESAQPSHGPYGDGSYGGAGQPVIRDVQARRNMQIQKPSVYPPQGNSGIAQNF